MYELKMNNTTRQDEIKSITELRQLDKEPDVGEVLKQKRIVWTDHVRRSNGLMKTAPKWKQRPLGRPKQKRICQKELSGDWNVYDEEILAQYRYKWKKVRVMVIDFKKSKKKENIDQSKSINSLIRF